MTAVALISLGTGIAEGQRGLAYLFGLAGQGGRSTASFIVELLCLSLSTAGVKAGIAVLGAAAGVWGESAPLDAVPDARWFYAEKCGFDALELEKIFANKSWANCSNSCTNETFTER